MKDEKVNVLDELEKFINGNQPYEVINNLSQYVEDENLKKEIDNEISKQTLLKSREGYKILKEIFKATRLNLPDDIVENLISENRLEILSLLWIGLEPKEQKEKILQIEETFEKEGKFSRKLWFCENMALYRWRSSKRKLQESV